MIVRDGRKTIDHGPTPGRTADEDALVEVERGRSADAAGRDVQRRYKERLRQERAS